MKFVVIILLLALGGGGFFAWTQIDSKTKALEELANQNAQLTKDAEAAKQAATACEEAKKADAAQLLELKKATCKGVWSEETGCAEPKTVFKEPAGDETLCFGTNVDVKWDQGSVKAETVTLSLATSANAGKLAINVPNDGVYHWKLESTHRPVGEGNAFTIAPGMYRLRMTTAEGALLGKDTELFNIKKCDAKGEGKGGKTAKLPPSKNVKPKKKK